MKVVKEIMVEEMNWIERLRCASFLAWGLVIQVLGLLGVCKTKESTYSQFFWGRIKVE